MKYEKNDRWMQGFICAVCIAIYLEGCVSTPIKELFESGVANTTLDELTDMGIDEADMVVIKTHWNALHNIYFTE